MKLSKKSIEVFKYFSTLSTSILVREGNVLRARNAAKTIATKAILDESFPEEFTIYSIPEFLKTVNLFNEPEIEFNGSHMVISEGQLKVRYMYADKELYKNAPNNEDFVPSDVSWGINLKLDDTELQNIQKAANVLNLNTVSFTQDGIVVYSDKNKDSNNFKMNYSSDLVFTGGQHPEDFEINFPTTSLDVYTGKYSLEFFCSKRTGVKLVNEDSSMTVWLASNPSTRV
jgi:hypothetical protein